MELGELYLKLEEYLPHAGIASVASTLGTLVRKVGLPRELLFALVNLTYEAQVYSKEEIEALDEESTLAALTTVLNTKKDLN